MWLFAVAHGKLWLLVSDRLATPGLAEAPKCHSLNVKKLFLAGVGCVTIVISEEELRDMYVLFVGYPSGEEAICCTRSRQIRKPLLMGALHSRTRKKDKSEVQ